MRNIHVFKEGFAGAMGFLLVASLVTAFVFAYLHIGNTEAFTRSKELIQLASSIVAVVIGYYFGTTQAQGTITAIQGETKLALDQAQEARKQQVQALLDAQVAQAQAQAANQQRARALQDAQEAQAQAQEAREQRVRALQEKEQAEQVLRDIRSTFHPPPVGGDEARGGASGLAALQIVESYFDAKQVAQPH